MIRIKQDLLQHSDLQCAASTLCRAPRGLVPVKQKSRLDQIETANDLCCGDRILSRGVGLAFCKAYQAARPRATHSTSGFTVDPVHDT
ncbi:MULTISPECIES: hypothetical protein [unclassified Mesorhizobium]|uniref:hypothetical protein n=1 Tax=Mesorhizobium sp. LNHC229A00 TaxID=1287240 RepID=UPI0012EB57D7|nr:MULTISPECIES: hypothetical protein [unclassified Mesorhizobium]